MRLNKEDWQVLNICLIISIIMALFLTEMPTWDFCAFHNYNGWAFLNWRYDIDIMPTLFRTYFNPVVDAFSYLILNKLNYSGILYSLVDNLWYCAYIFISYLIFKTVFGYKTKENKFLVFSCFLLTIFSPMLILLHKLWCAMPQNVLALLALYLFIKTLISEKEPNKNLPLLFSAFLMGLTVGLKYTFVSFAIAWIVCFIVNYKPNKQNLYSLCKMIISMFLGFLIADGWWMYYLYKRFNNPIYPYLNNLFNPDDGDISTVLKQDFLSIKPKNFVQYIFYPLVNSRKYGGVGYEQRWFDIKVPLTYISIIVYYILTKFKKAENLVAEIIDPKIFNIIVIYTITTYIINLFLFGVVRYLIVLIPLIVIIIAVTCWAISKVTNSVKNLPNIFIVGTIILTSFYVMDFSVLSDFAICLYSVFYAVGIFIFIFYTKLKPNIKCKGYIVSMLLLFLISLETCLIPIQTIKFFKHKDNKIMDVEKLNIEDDSVVLLSMLSTFLVPYQNPNVQYMGVTIPASLSNEHRNRNEQANYMFQNKQLEKSIEKALAEKENVYFLYSKDFVNPETYMTYINFYAKGKIKNDLGQDCKNVSYILYGFYNNSENYVLCKLK